MPQEIAAFFMYEDSLLNAVPAGRRVAEVGGF